MNGFEEDMSYKPCIIQAHAHELAAMALSPTGNLLATASNRVYMIKIKKSFSYIFFLLIGYSYTYIFNNRIM
jgi:hypothetical protein